VSYNYIITFWLYTSGNLATKNKYTDKELAEFEGIINVKMDKALEQLDYYMKQIKVLADSPEAKVRGLDDGIGTMENERLYTMASRQRKLIHHLESARLRIGNKTYGICRESGNLISKARLKAVPHATLSIEAKQKR